MTTPTTTPLWERPPEPRREGPHIGALDLVLASAVVLIQLLSWLYYSSWGGGIFITLATAAAVALARSRPAIALGIVWFSGAVLIWMGLDPHVGQVGVAWVAYCTARYARSNRLLVTSGVSAVAGTVIGAVYLYVIATQDPTWYQGFVGSAWRTIQTVASPSGILGLLAPAFTIVLPLIAPWLSGFVLRLTTNSRRSEQARAAAVKEKSAAEELRDLAQRERENAMRVAAVEAHQARLARDVHDVVGHSLAVILAQAQAGQLVSGEDAMRETLESIASSARRSLGEVRQVLGELRDGTPQEAPVDGIDALVDSLRVAGVDVREQVTGQPQPLPPEVETVVYRVVQEMVTNVLKHGRTDKIVSIDYLWQGGLRVQVRNYVAETPGGGHGSGIAGMRARLESVGGALEILRYDSNEGEIVSTTAWVPRGGMA